MLNSMLEKIKNKEMTAEQVAAELSNLTWAKRNVDTDGTVWWSEGNDASDIDVAVATGDLTHDHADVLYKALENLNWYSPCLNYVSIWEHGHNCLLSHIPDIEDMKKKNIILPLLSLPFLVLMVSFYFVGQEQEDCTVTSMEANPKDEQGGQYQFHTVETTCGDFTVGRNYQRGHMLDKQIKHKNIQVGETYTFDTTGYRFSPFNKYPHIVEVYVKDESGELHIPLENPPEE